MGGLRFLRTVALLGYFAALAFVGLAVLGQVSSLRVPPAWLTLVGLLAIQLLSGTDNLSDALAFASSTIPTLGLAAVALVLPWPANAACDLLAFASLLLWSPLLIRRSWPFWWSVVLRRPPLPVWWAFDRTLDEHATEFRRLGERAVADARKRDQMVRNLAPRVGRLRKKRAPTREWAQLRDDLVDWEDAWLERMRAGDLEFADLSGRASEITSRRDALRSA